MTGRGGVIQSAVFGSTAPGTSCETLDRGVLTGWNNGLIGRRLIDVGEADPLHGVEVIQVAPELLEAVCRWQRRRFIAEVVLAELAGVVAEIQQEFCYRGRARQQRTGGTRKLRHDHARPQRMHAGGEGGAPGRAALLGIIGHKPRTFIREAVDVGRLPNHEPLMVGTHVHDADVIAHDEQDVGLVTGVGGLGAADGQTGRQGQDRASGFEPRHGGRFRGPSFVESHEHYPPVKKWYQNPAPTCGAGVRVGDEGTEAERALVAASRL